jgi:hypothetical protein
MSLTAYELTGRAEFLDAFCIGADSFLEIVQEQNGQKGWYGKPIEPLRHPDKPDLKIFEIQNEFRAVGVLSRFGMIVRNDPNLADRFAAKAKVYLDLAESSLVPKWENYYANLANGAGVYLWHREYAPKIAGITLSHEKQSIIIEGLLNLADATGRPLYRERAERLGKFLKQSMRDVNGHYEWNFWDPAGDWDKAADGKLRHWIGAEPNGFWYAATVGSAVQLYQHGLVFDETDIQKLVRTQMDVCWNGNQQSPVYLMVNGKKSPKPNERFVAPVLAAWNDTLAQFIYNGPGQAERLKKTDDFWNGGIVAGEWLRGKYIMLPGGRAKTRVDSK